MTVREVALRALYRFETEDADVRETLNALLRQSSLDTRDRALATELVYGIVRRLGRIDWVLQQFVRRFDELTPWIRNILRLGGYQILILDQVPDAAATFESVELAKRFGHPGTVRLTNGVLRNLIRNREDISFPNKEKEPVAHLSAVYSYPSWIVQRWIDRYGVAEAEALCKAGNRPPPVMVRVNRLRTDPETVTETLEESGVLITPGRYLDVFLVLRHTGNIRSLKGFREGWFQVQDESAGLAVRTLDPQPGETIVDLCCAPGGKTAYMAELMRNRGRIIGVDQTPGRLKKMQEHRRRLGLSSMLPVVMDGKTCTLRHQVDRVLVDAPCSGLGTIARRTELRWRRMPEDIPALQETQSALLAQGARLVKPGGVIVYSTCTIEPEENEDIVAAFCERNTEFSIETPSDTAVSGLLDDRGMVQTLPSTHGVDGSFAVKLRKG